MTCRELVEFLMQYLDGELSADEQRRFEEHLGECEPCVAYLKQYEETIRVGKAAMAPSDEPVPREVPEELVEAILAARPKHS
jgi:anti-sigma factor RsiW